MELGLAGDLGQHSHHPSDKVKRQIPEGVHRVFDLGTKGPQEYHVPQDVRPTAVHEHGRQNRNPMMAGNHVRGNRGPLEDECITTLDFKIQKRRSS